LADTPVARGESQPSHPGVNLDVNRYPPAPVTGQEVPVHVKVDTGMGRLGFAAGDGGVREVMDLFREPGLQLEGVFTHFAVADEDIPFTREQIRRFREFVGALRRAGLQIPLCHACNSAGVLEFPDAALDMVRPGIMLYGVYPSETVKRSVRVRPFLTWKTRVAQVRVVPEGEAVSYGRTYIADRPVRIATLPVGYADGYPRGLSNRGEVLIRGRRCGIAGRVCMDQTMVVVPPELCDLAPGAEVTLLGDDGEESIPVDEIAGAMDTIPHEIFTGIDKRVPRLFRWNGRVIGESSVLNV
ncbi:MAG: alanine racemase, partial [Bacillota bacterium]